MHRSNRGSRPPWNLLVIFGFVLTWVPLVPFAGFVLCLIGGKQCRQTGARGRGLAVAGVVLNLLFIAAAMVALFAYVGGFGAPPGYI